MNKLSSVEMHRLVGFAGGYTVWFLLSVSFFFLRGSVLIPLAMMFLFYQWVLPEKVQLAIKRAPRIWRKKPVQFLAVVVLYLCGFALWFENENSLVSIVMFHGLFWLTGLYFVLDGFRWLWWYHERESLCSSHEQDKRNGH